MLFCTFMASGLTGANLFCGVFCTLMVFRRVSARKIPMFSPRQRRQHFPLCFPPRQRRKSFLRVSSPRQRRTHPPCILRRISGGNPFLHVFRVAGKQKEHDPENITRTFRFPASTCFPAPAFLLLSKKVMVFFVSMGSCFQIL